ncbi:DNA-3-methyladenine glycosylase [Micromonospora sp. AMSO12t]|uniref:DNA-3-methyladenine glycosylase n=1 Tax=Micromonospora sp. AMSO12t TaxID=2650410 RepID=UPI001788CAE9
MTARRRAAPADRVGLVVAYSQRRPADLAGLADLLAGPVVPAARGLLGCRLTAGDVTVRITEVEAYAGTAGDPASHAHRGRTPRNAVMFGPAGHAYVYFTYGMHWCMNVVTGPDGEASAVLLRAGEVVDGVETARARRPAVRRDVDLARGPARLCAALGIDKSAYGRWLLGDGPVRLRPADVPVPGEAVAAGPRVGVTGAHDVPWRFWIAGDPTVSAYRRHVPRSR